MTESRGHSEGHGPGMDGVPGGLGGGVQDSLQGEVPGKLGGERHSNNSRCGFLDSPWTTARPPTLGLKGQEGCLLCFCPE